MYTTECNIVKSIAMKNKIILRELEEILQTYWNYFHKEFSMFYTLTP